MYNFLFYFFFRLFSRFRVSDTTFTAKLWTFIVISFHMLVLLKLLSALKLIDKMPVFSSGYVYNKLAWFLPLSVVLIIVFIYYNKKKTTDIMEKSNRNETFFTAWNVFYFLMFFLVPIALLLFLHNTAS